MGSCTVPLGAPQEAACTQSLSNEIPLGVGVRVLERTPNTESQTLGDTLCSGKLAVGKARRPWNKTTVFLLMTLHSV